MSGAPLQPAELADNGSDDRFLDTAAVRAQLKPRTVRSVIVALTGRALSALLSLVSVTVLARLLTPNDFGVIAMVIPIATVASMTLSLGLNFALLHEEQLSANQTTHLFWMAQGFNVLSLGLMALSAPLLVTFYREPRVAAVAVIWAATLAVQGLGTIHEALLKRQLRFGTLTTLHVSGIAVGTLLAIVAAASGAGHVALLLPIIVGDVARTVGAWMLCGWRPRRFARHDRSDPVVRRLVAYGANLALFRGVYWAGRQADRLVVGYAAGATAAGLYDGSRRWSWYPFHELFQSLTDVAVASLSRARRDAEGLRASWRRGLTAFLAVPLPVIAFIFVQAESTVRLLLGERWMDAVPLVRIMSVGAFAGSLGRLTMWIYTAEGRTRQQLRWGLLTTPVMIAAVLVGARGGAQGVAWAFVLATIGLMLPTVAFCLRGSLLGWGDILAIVWRPMAASAVAAAVSYFLREAMAPLEPLLIEFLAHALVFALVYVAVWLALPGGVTLTRELMRLFKSAVTPRKEPP